jgi:hypothetical protein
MIDLLQFIFSWISFISFIICWQISCVIEEENSNYYF